MFYESWLKAGTLINRPIVKIPYFCFTLWQMKMHLGYFDCSLSYYAQRAIDWDWCSNFD